MRIEPVGPGGVSNAFGSRDTQDGNFKRSQRYGKAFGPSGGGDVSLYRPFVYVPFANTIVVDCKHETNFRIVASANFTLGAPINMRGGEVYNFKIHQDSVGGRTITYSPVFRWPDGMPNALTATANGFDFISMVYDEIDEIFVCTMLKGYTLPS